MNSSWVITSVETIRYKVLIFLLTTFFCTVLLSPLEYSIGGISIMAYQLIGMVFLIFFWLHKLLQTRSSLARKNDVLPIIYLFILIILGAAFSSIGAFIMLGTFTQYIKGFFEIIFMNIFFITLILFLGENKYEDAKKFLYILIFFTTLSCFYQFFTIYFQLNYGILLDNLIWPKISSWDGIDESKLLIGSSEARGFRHGGFLGSANTMATLIICALPISLLIFQSKSKWMIFVVSIFFISTLSGMSRSGIAGMVIALLAMFISSGPIKLRSLFLTALYLSLIIIFLYIVENFFGTSYISGFLELLIYRSEVESYQDSSRYQLLLAGLDMLDQSPIFGVGINSSAILLQNYSISIVTGGSLHNYWLELFVASGLFAIPAVTLYLFMLFKSIKTKNIYSKALFATLCGLLVNGFFHSSIAKPGIQVFIVLLYLCSLTVQYNTNNNSINHAGK